MKDTLMKSKSPTAKLVSKSIADLRAPSVADRKRLRAAAARSADLSEIAKRPWAVESQPAVGGAIRAAIVAEMNRKKLTAYALWRLASKHCETLPNAAVYQFLRGQRQVRVDYAEAMMAALGLHVRG